jgi:orotidine-5'-phosphate decarboxylase
VAPDLVIALDLPAARDALRLADDLGDAVSWYKVGPVLFVRDGTALVRELRARGKRVFLDLKWHDIPNTVAGAVGAAGELGVDLASVHLAGGERMLGAAVAACAAGLRLVGIGVLTSLTGADYAAAVGRPVGDLALEQQRLVRLGLAARLHGFVCAAAEARALRTLAPHALLVVPGIRGGADPAGDQARTATPGEAVSSGADLLVVGRPVYGASDPRRAVAALRAEMAA